MKEIINTETQKITGIVIETDEIIKTKTIEWITKDTLEIDQEIVTNDNLEVDLKIGIVETKSNNIKKK